MEVLVSGGLFDNSGVGWIDRVRPGHRERLITFQPPQELLVPKKGFTGLTIIEGDLVVCSFNAVWCFDRDGQCRGRLHLPHFNDLHGIAYDEETKSLLVCNTGLDAVEVLDISGRWRGRFAMTPPPLESMRFEGKAVQRSDVPGLCTAGWENDEINVPSMTIPDGDYYNTDPDIEFSHRRVRDYFHPNDVTVSKSHGTCVTLLMNSSIYSLSTHQDLLQTPGPPHDGIEAEDGFWYTTVSGDVIRHTEEEGAQVFVSLRGTQMAGWCRGLVLSQGWGAVGVTAMKGKDSVVPWSGGDWKSTRTGVVWFDRESGDILDFLDMTDTRRGAKIFTLIQPVFLG